MDKPYKIIKSNIRHYRGLARITQEQLAERSGISWSYLSAIESGSKYPSLKVIMKIAAALEVDLHLFFLEQEKSPVKYRDLSTLNHSIEKIAEKVEYLETRLNHLDSD